LVKALKKASLLSWVIGNDTLQKQACDSSNAVAPFRYEICIFEGNPNGGTVETPVINLKSDGSETNPPVSFIPTQKNQIYIVG